MNLRDLHYLVALIDHRHFGKAAKVCCVSQPALSMQLKKLEETLGIQLIERTNKSFLLTDEGKIIAEHARQVLNQVATMRDFAKKVKNPFLGEINIGIIPTLAPYLLPHIMPGLIKKFPQLKIYLIEDKTPNLIKNLKEGKMEAAILALPLVHENFSTLPLFEEEFFLAMPDNHKLAKKKQIQEKDLQPHPLLLLEEGHCLRDQALIFCEQFQAETINHFKATSLETLRHMVAAKVGLTLMPGLACGTQAGVSYRPFHKIKPKRTVGMVWRSLSSKNILLENLVLTIRLLLAKQKLVKVIRTELVCDD